MFYTYTIEYFDKSYDNRISFEKISVVKILYSAVVSFATTFNINIERERKLSVLSLPITSTIAVQLYVFFFLFQQRTRERVGFFFLSFIPSFFLLFCRSYNNVVTSYVFFSLGKKKKKNNTTSFALFFTFLRHLFFSH